MATVHDYIPTLATGQTSIPGLTLEVQPVGESDATDLQTLLEEFDLRLSVLEGGPVDKSDGK